RDDDEREQRAEHEAREPHDEASAQHEPAERARSRAERAEDRVLAPPGCNQEPLRAVEAERGEDHDEHGGAYGQRGACAIRRYALAPDLVDPSDLADPEIDLPVVDLP